MRVLIADGDDTRRTLLERSITEWGHEAVLARDGEEAWKLLQEQGDAIVALLDESLPRMTGTEICRRARGRNLAPFVYLILLTTQDDACVPALEAGADDCLRIPYAEAELRARIGVAVRLTEQFALLSPSVAATGERLGQPHSSEEQLRLLTDRLPVLLSYVDADERYRFANRAYESWFGCERSAIIGRQLREVLGEEAYQSIRPHVERVIAGQQVTFEALVPYQGEGERYVRATYVPDLEGGQVRGYVALIQDITATRQMEEETRRLRASLSHADRLSRLGILTTTLAHELRQPLAAILTNAQAAQRFLNADPPDLNEVRQILADMIEENRRAADVVRDLRNLATQDAPRSDALEVNALVGGVVRLCHSDALLHQVTLAEQLTHDLPAICGDATQIQQVLLNLIANAIAATSTAPPGRRVVTVITELVPEQKARVCIRDRGPGIPEDQIEALFEPLQATKSVSGRLGLAFSRSLVEQHGGRLWAESNPEGGTTFCVEFPAV